MLSRMALVRSKAASNVLQLGGRGRAACMSTYSDPNRSHVATPKPTPEEAKTHRPDPLLFWNRASTTKQVSHFTSYALATGIPAAMVAGAPLVNVMDFAMGVIIPLHTHIGLRSVVVDYVWDPKQQSLVLKGLAAFTVLTAFGMTKLNMMDVGITGSIKKLWTV